jgi:glycosyltransferase involved in cell wall biosynthesis
MEVIHIILGKANPERMNGVNKVIYDMATKQVSHGENVSVWGITKDTVKNYGDRNFETRLFSKKRNPFGISSDLKKAILTKKDAAVFHFHGGWIPVYFSLSRLLHKHKIPYVLTPHGAYNTIAMKKSQLLKKWYLRFFEKRVLQKASKIHCLGASETIGLQSICKTDQIVLLPYGYETKTKPAIENQFDKDQFVFGFIGRLDIYTKGLDKLINGFGQFAKTHPNAKLWIVGDSNEREKLHKIIQDKGLSDHIILFGSKFGKHKETLLKNMDVFVHPSRNEGLPASVIEAASLGKPCIVSQATNIGNLVEEYDAGRMITSTSSKQIKKAMEHLFETWQKPESFTKMCYNATRMIKENYDWEKIIENYKEQLYQYP